MKTFFLIFVLLMCSIANNQNTNFGKYTCSKDEILIIYEFELPHAIHMKCARPSLCGESLSCATTASTCPASGLSFLNGIVEKKKYEELMKTCCSYFPYPEDYVSTQCFHFNVTDKPLDANRTLLRSEVPSEVEQFLNRRTKRANSRRYGLATVYSRKLNGTEQQLLVVKDINRIRDGYQITGCGITCKEDDDIISERKLPPRARQIDLKFGESPACFSADSVVLTPTGRKYISELRHNEQVLVSSIENGGPIYQPIEMWYHRISDQQAQFIIIQTTHTKLSLSPGHLLPLVDCQSVKSLKSDELSMLVASESKFAYRAAKGRCLIVYLNGHFMSEPVERVHTEVKRGVYSPITPQGTLIVDSVHVSCFTTLENHWAQHAFHKFMKRTYDILRRFIGFQDDEIDIPAPIKLIHRLAYLILPETMF